MIESVALAVAPLAVNPAVTTLIQTIVVAALVFLGQYMVAKMSNKAQRKTIDVDSQSKATAA